MEDLTSFHARRAVAGEAASESWIVEHFSPALLLQAGYRLRGALRNYYAPEDLVHDVWAISLPRLPQLEARDGRWTPVLVRFLSTTLLNRANELLREFARGARPHREDSMIGSAGPSAGMDGLSTDSRSVQSVAELREMQAVLHETLEELSERDREVLVLRGIEQVSNQRVAEKLGENPPAVAMRYHRALQRLRQALPNSVFGELDGDR